MTTHPPTRASPRPKPEFPPGRGRPPTKAPLALMIWLGRLPDPHHPQPCPR